MITFFGMCTFWYKPVGKSWNMKQCLQRWVQVAGITHILHTSPRRPCILPTKVYLFHREQNSFWLWDSIFNGFTAFWNNFLLMFKCIMYKLFQTILFSKVAVIVVGILSMNQYQKNSKEVAVGKMLSIYSISIRLIQLDAKNDSFWFNWMYEIAMLWKWQQLCEQRARPKTLLYTQNTEYTRTKDMFNTRYYEFRVRYTYYTYIILIRHLTKLYFQFKINLRLLLTETWDREVKKTVLQYVR